MRAEIQAGKLLKHMGEKGERQKTGKHQLRPPKVSLGSFLWFVNVVASRVENRRSDCSLPVDIGLGFRRATSVRFGLVLFPVPALEPDWQISRIRLSEKTHDVTCDAVCNF